MDIKPVWISSISHLDAFTEIWINAPLWRKLLGFYEIPDDFPLVKLYHIFGFPVVFFSEGNLVLEDNNLAYESFEKKSILLNKFSNLKSDLSFKIKISDIKSIQWYQHKYAFINYYHIKWIRIICDENTLGGDFLICIGGNGPFMNKITKNTEDLFEKLIKLQNHKVD